MSFAEQERALFDLLFEPTFRHEFARDRELALASYTLTAEERADFAHVRLDALALDADMRRELVLQHMCRALPVTFSIASSLAGGLDHARTLIDASFIRTLPGERAPQLGRGLRAWLTTAKFLNALEQSAAVALCDAELSMTLTASSLRTAVSEGSKAPVPEPRGDTWVEKPLTLAPYVSVALLSQSYAALKRALCPVVESELWPRLCTAPLPALRRSQTLAHQSPRLFVTRAEIARASVSETTVNHRMLELSPGFGPLLSHLDGKMSLADLLGELRKAGAQESICQGVRTGFEKLLDEGMVR